MASDSSIVGLVGPVLSRDMLAMGDILAAAGIIAATPSATMPALSAAGWPNFFRGVANEDDWPTASAMYLTRRLGVQQVCVVNLDYDEYLLAGRQVTDLLGPVADPACSATIGPDANSYGPVVESIRIAAPDVVYLAADMFAAGEVCSALRKSGVTAKIFGSDGVQARQFIKQAGSAAIGVLTAGTFQLPTEALSAAYEEEFDEAPWHYSVEAYELAGIMIEGIASGAVTDRSSMLHWFTGYSGYGAITHYQWADTGELITRPVFLAEVS
jgi:branched-chain amino acid transport system substrate-binding protein